METVTSGLASPWSIAFLPDGQLLVTQRSGSIVRLNAKHHPANLKTWMGDSIGWWEGDTLVIETVHVNPQQGRNGPVFLSPEGKVTERLTRLGPDRLGYAFTVRNPGGHSSRPRPDNAIYELSTALKKLEAHRFTPAMTETTRAYLQFRQKQEQGPLGDAMRRWLANKDAGEAVSDVIGGRVNMFMSSPSSIAEHVERIGHESG